MNAVGSYDYVVVGAGSGGSVVARRLLDAGATVALVEAGGPATNPAIHDPGRWPELSLSDCDWGYFTDPQEACAGRRLHWPRGKVIGGSGALNGMAYIRGHRLDYDGWAYHGCPGWSYDDVLPVFKRSEDFDGGESHFHGVGGPLRVTTRYEPHPLIASMVAAAQEAGIPFNEDHNGAELDGVGYTQLNVRRRRARDGGDGVRRTRRRRPRPGDLHGRPGPPAALLRAALLRCRDREGGGIEVVEARAEVVVSAGTIDSPRLLLLSGIGPADELPGSASRAIVDLPGVGRNLHDHLLSPVILSSPKPIPPRLAGLTQLHAHLFWRSRPGLVVPDTQPLCFHIPLYVQDWMAGPPDAYTILGGLIRTETRGAIRLRSADPDAPLSIDPRCLACDSDLAALAASVALCREIGRQPALAEWSAAELYPGPDVRTSDELRDYVRRTAVSYHHQVGTCRMGQDEDAVVDPELRVRGVDGLRVADASVMPFVTTGNTNAPTIMIGEKASDAIRAAQGQPRYLAPVVDRDDVARAASRRSSSTSAACSPPITTTLTSSGWNIWTSSSGSGLEVATRTARRPRPPAGGRSSASRCCPSTPGRAAGCSRRSQSISFCFVSKPRSTNPRATSGSSTRIGPTTGARLENGSPRSASAGTSPPTCRAGRCRRSCTSRRGRG